MLALTGCALFGGGGDEASRPPKTTFPDLSDVPPITEEQNTVDRAAVIQDLEMRRLLAAFDRDVLDPTVLEDLPRPPSSERDPLVPMSLINAARGVREDRTLAPPPSAMPPVLPAGGVPGKRPGQAQP